MTSQTRNSAALLLCGLLALSGCASNQDQHPHAAGETSAARETQTWPLVSPDLRVDFGKVSQSTTSEVVDVLSVELRRSFELLRAQRDPVHFLAYQVVEQDGWAIAATDGALVASDHTRSRNLDVDLRVGSPARDSTHRLPGDAAASTYRGATALPLNGHGQAFRDAVWLATDQAYEVERQQWMRVQANEQTKDTGAEDEPMDADFSQEPAVVQILPTSEIDFEPAPWEELLRRVSARASSYPEVMESGVTLNVLGETRSYVSSDGSRVRLGEHRVRLVLQVATLADDGMPLERFETIDVRELGQLPSERELVLRFTQLFEDVRALGKAPLIEPYAGPAILDGRAAGVFFHEIFGHRIEGHRQDSETEGQTFASLVGQQVMSDTLNIYDDPRIFALNGTQLNGYYPFDDEAVPAQRANLVEAGVLETFLLSRTPARGFDRSNGHGRRQAGHGVVARQANLVVEPRQAVSRESLKLALLAEVERQGLPYGLRFREITGGFTQTQRFDTQAFKVMPVMVYKVLPDGSEHLVRGVDIEGTPLTALSKITLAANDYETFNGVCGAESGWVPVSATSPSILVAQIEVARQEQTELRPPLLEPPSVTTPSVTTPSVTTPSVTTPSMSGLGSAGASR